MSLRSWLWGAQELASRKRGSGLWDDWQESDGHGSEWEGVGQRRSVRGPNTLTTTPTYVRGEGALKEILTPLFKYIGTVGLRFILESKELERTEMKQIP